MKDEITELKNIFNSRIEALHQLINDHETNTFITTTKIDKGVEEINNKIREIDKVNSIAQPAITANNKPCMVELTMPTFNGDNTEEHPKKFLRNLNTYITYTKITKEETMIAIENCLKGKAAKWFTMIKDAVLDKENFKEQFLKYFFSESKQWEIFIKCIEAGKEQIKNNFQEHFHY